MYQMARRALHLERDVDMVFRTVIRGAACVSGLQAATASATASANHVRRELPRGVLARCTLRATAGTCMHGERLWARAAIDEQRGLGSKRATRGMSTIGIKGLGPRAGNISKGRASRRSPELLMNDYIMGSGNVTSTADFVLLNISEMRPINIATAFNQLAKKYKATGKKIRSSENVQLCFATLEEKMLQDLNRFGARPLSSALLAMAQVRHHPSEEFWAAVDERMAATAHTFNSIDIANSLNALAKLGYKPSPKLREEVDANVWARCSELRNQEITSILWAFQKMGHAPSKGLLGALEAQTLDKVADFWSQNISITFYSFAQLGHVPSDELLQAADSSMLAKLTFFSPQNIANTLWAFAKFKYQPSERLLAAVDKHLCSAVRASDRRSLGNMAWALAQFGHRPSAKLVSALRAEIRDRGERFDGATRGLLAQLVPDI